MIDIKIGDEIALHRNVGSEHKTFRVTVYAVEGDFITISQPITNGNYYPLNRDTLVELAYNRENSGMLLFECVVIQRTMIDGLFAVRLKKTSEIRKVQRRQFFRVPVVVKGNINCEEKKIDFFTRDLSGGGMLISTDEEIHEGTEFEGNIDLEGSAISFASRVVRKTKYKDKYALGLYFTKLSPVAENKIVTYCFDKQRKLKPKG